MKVLSFKEIEGVAGGDRWGDGRDERNHPTPSDRDRAWQEWAYIRESFSDGWNSFAEGAVSFLGDAAKGVMTAAGDCANGGAVGAVIGAGIGGSGGLGVGAAPGAVAGSAGGCVIGAGVGLIRDLR